MNEKPLLPRGSMRPNRFNSLKARQTIGVVIFYVMALSIAYLPVSAQCDLVRSDLDKSYPTPPAAAAVGRKDAAALQEIRDHIRVVGFKNWRDLRATGTFTAYESETPVQHPARVFILGPRNFRLETDLPGGRQVFVVSGFSGVSISPDGSKKGLEPRQAFVAPNAFLTIRDLAILQDARTTIIDQGQVTISNKQLHRITLAISASPSSRNRILNSSQLVADYYFNIQDHTLHSLASCVSSADSSLETYLQVVFFGNYQTVAGASVPGNFEWVFGGQRLWSVNLTDFQKDSGIDPADFSF